MGRTLTAPEQAALGTGAAVMAPHARSYPRLEVADALGVFQDLTYLLHGFRIGTDVDQTVIAGSVQLARSHQDYVGSISPLVTDAVDAGRRLRLHFTTLLGSAGVPAAGDLQLVLDGVVDKIDAGAALVELQVRDRIGATLADFEMVNGITVPADTALGPQSVEGMLLYALLNTGTLTGTPGDVTPPFLFSDDFSASGATITQDVEIEPQRALEVVRAIAQRIGWQVRPRWHEGDGEFKLAFYPPDHAKATVDWTIPASRYHVIPRLERSREHIRNAVRIRYVDADGQQRQFPADAYAYTDAASIAKYGYRFAEFVEDASSPIRSEAAAQAFADLFLGDMSEPVVDLEVELHMLWPVDIDDMVTLGANAEQLGTARTFAVVGYEHEFGPRTERTRLKLRGRPTGGITKWVRRPPRRTWDPEARENQLLSWRQVHQDEAGTTFEGVVGAAVAHVNVYTQTLEQGAGATTADLEHPSHLVDILTPDAERRVEITIATPPRGFVSYGLAVPYTDIGDGILRAGLPKKAFTVYPLGAGAPVWEIDAADDGVTGTVWLRLQEQGIPYAAPTFRVRVGDLPFSVPAAATRTAGAASTVRGGLLGEEGYEFDFGLDAWAPSAAVADVVLETGEVVSITFPALDQGRTPDFTTAPLFIDPYLHVNGEPDVRAIRVERTDGTTWSVTVDGWEHAFDLSAADDASNPGQANNTRASYLVTLFSDPKADIDGGTLTATRNVSVVRGTPGASASDWDAPPLLTVPAVGSSVMGITLDASAAPAGSYVELFYRYQLAGDPWSDPVDIASLVSPALTLPPTSPTAYTFDTDFVRKAKVTPLPPAVIAEIVANIRDSGGGLLRQAVSNRPNWYVQEA